MHRVMDRVGVEDQATARVRLLRLMIRVGTRPRPRSRARARDMARGWAVMVDAGRLGVQGYAE